MPWDELDEEETYEEEEEEGGGIGCLSILFFLLFACLIATLIGAATLPSFLASPKGKSWAERRVNRWIAPDKITLGDIKATWFSGVEISNLCYQSKANGILFETERAKSSFGLLRLMPVGTLNLGEVEFMRPTCIVQRPAEPPQENESSGGFFFLPVADVAGTLVVRDGSMRVYEQGEGKTPFTAHKIEASAAVSSFRKPIAVRLAFQTPGGGAFSLSGDLQSLKEMKDGKRYEQPRKLSLAAENLALRELQSLFGTDLGIADGKANGKLDVELLSAGSANAKGDVKIAGFRLAVEKGRKMQSSDLTFRLDGGVDSGNIRIEQLDVASPWLKANGRGMLAPQGSGAVMGSLRLKADLDLTKFARDFRKAFGEKLPPMVGNVALELSTSQYATQTGISAMLAFDDFVLSPAKGQTSVIPKGKLTFDASVPISGTMPLPELRDGAWRLTSGEDSCVGSFSRIAWGGKTPEITKGSAKLSGTAKGLLKLLGAFIPKSTAELLRDVEGKIELSATGNAENGSAAFELSLADGEVIVPEKATGITYVPVEGAKANIVLPFVRPDLWHGTATLNLGAVSACGLFAGPAPFSLKWNGTKSEVNWAPNLNGGKGTLKCSANITPKGTLIHFPVKTRVCENAEITQSMVDKWLVAINPFFEKSRVKSGTVTADVLRFEWDSAKPPATGLTAEFDLLFRDVRVILGPSFDELLSALNVNNRLFETKRLPMHILIRNGRVEMGKTTFSLDGASATISGWSTFDGKIRYNVEVPMTEALFKRWGVGFAGKLLSGKTIPITITGTCDKPVFDLGGIAETLRGVKQSTGKATEKSADWLLELKKSLLK